MTLGKLRFISKIFVILSSGVVLPACMGGGSSSVDLTSGVGSSGTIYKTPSDTFVDFTGSFTSSGLASNVQTTRSTASNGQNVIASFDVAPAADLTTFTTTADAAKTSVSTSSAVTGKTPQAFGGVKSNGADLFRGLAAGSNDYDYLLLSNLLSSSLGTTTLSYAYIGYGAVAKTSVEGDKTKTDEFLFSLFGGQKTAASDMPTTGSAFYQGGFSGQIVSADTSAGARSASDLDGRFTMSANFGGKTVSGAILDVRRLVGLSQPPQPTSVNISFSGAISGNEFSANAVLTDVSKPLATGSGTMRGGFFGPKAAEAAGALAIKQVDGSTTSLVHGSFGGKKQ